MQAVGFLLATYLQSAVRQAFQKQYVPVYNECSTYCVVQVVCLAFLAYNRVQLQKCHELKGHCPM